MDFGRDQKPSRQALAHSPILYSSVEIGVAARGLDHDCGRRRLGSRLSVEPPIIRKQYDKIFIDIL